MSDNQDNIKSNIPSNISTASFTSINSDNSSITSNTTLDSLTQHNESPIRIPLTLTKKQINTLQLNAASDIRRILSNIILLLFRNHPNGIFEYELSKRYTEMFAENICINNDLRYILSTHRSINITKTKSYGILYTLNPNQLLNEIKSINPILLQTYLIEHILKIFNYFPNGIAVSCFDQTFQNILQFKLSHIIPQWTQFIVSIPYIICFKVQQVNVFINTFHIYKLKQFIHSNQILTYPSGFPQLFHQLKSTNIGYFNEKHFEKAFLLKYKSPIHCSSPYIASILSQMYRKHDNISAENNNKSPYSEDHCSVFMGGFSHGTKICDIKSELNLMGFNVINCTELKYRKFGFSWVTLSSSYAADKLISKSPIKICGNNIDIRPFLNRDFQKHKPNNNIILNEIIKLLSKNKNKKFGLSIRDIRPMLFKTFQYRISGSDLTEIVKSNPKNLFIKIDKNGTEKIFVSNKCHRER